MENSMTAPQKVKSRDAMRSDINYKKKKTVKIINTWTSNNTFFKK